MLSANENCILFIFVISSMEIRAAKAAKCFILHNIRYQKLQLPVSSGRRYKSPVIIGLRGNN